MELYVENKRQGNEYEEEIYSLFFLFATKRYTYIHKFSKHFYYKTFFFLWLLLPHEEKDNIGKTEKQWERVIYRHTNGNCSQCALN